MRHHIRVRASQTRTNMHVVHSINLIRFNKKHKTKQNRKRHLKTNCSQNFSQTEKLVSADQTWLYMVNKTFRPCSNQHDSTPDSLLKILLHQVCGNIVSISMAHIVTVREGAKKNKKYGLKFKLSAVKYAEENLGEAAARHFSVDPKRVRDWWKNKTELSEEDRWGVYRECWLAASSPPPQQLHLQKTYDYCPAGCQRIHREAGEIVTFSSQIFERK